jgi:hypothetical protein
MEFSLKRELEEMHIKEMEGRGDWLTGRKMEGDEVQNDWTPWLIPYRNGPLLIDHGWLFHPILEYATNPVEHAGTHPNRRQGAVVEERVLWW